MLPNPHSNVPASSAKIKQYNREPVRVDKQLKPTTFMLYIFFISIIVAINITAVLNVLFSFI